jgi:CBS domain containing-hemolysin-like protein
MFTVIFAPLAAILWSLGRLLEWILGNSPERVQLSLVRSELKRVLTEGHEAGVLVPTQRQMADGMFEVAAMPLDRFSVPTSKLTVARQSMSRQEMLRIARRRRSAVLFIQDQRRELIGFLHVIDLHLAEESPKPTPIVRISRRESTIAALTQLQKDDQPYAAVMGDNGKVLGIVEARQLAESILHSGRSDR